MKTDSILKAIDSVVVLPPALRDRIEELLNDDALLSDEYMSSRFEKVHANMWIYNGHYLTIHKRALVTPTHDCKVKFWCHTVSDLEAALSFIDNED